MIEPVRHGVLVQLPHPHCIRQPERIHYDLTQAMGVTTVEHIALLIIGGIFALSLIVPVAFIVYMGALILFSDLSDDE
jgi:hypothetical protein